MRLSLELAGLAALALAACLGAGAARAEQCAGIGGQVQPRSHIPMFIYAGTADNDAKSHFERFRSLIGGKLSMLAEETRLDFLPDFGLYLPGGQPLPDTVQRQADRDRYWDKTNALQLLRGTVLIYIFVTTQSVAFLYACSSKLGEPSSSSCFDERNRRSTA